MKGNFHCLLGNGRNINFWLDHWLEISLVQKFNVPDKFYNILTTLVGDYLINMSWSIPTNPKIAFSNLESFFSKCYISMENIDDNLVWYGNDDGLLSLKQAYDFLKKLKTCNLWCKFPWKTSIAPSKSVILWRFVHNRTPTDENLSRRGRHTLLMLSLCNDQNESTIHISFECNFTSNIWIWFSGSFSLNHFIISFSNCWKFWTRIGPPPNACSHQYVICGLVY